MVYKLLILLQSYLLLWVLYKFINIMSYILFVIYIIVWIIIELFIPCLININYKQMYGMHDVYCDIKNKYTDNDTDNKSL